MKKVVLTTMAVVIAAVAAQAQSARVDYVLIHNSTDQDPLANAGYHLAYYCQKATSDKKDIGTAIDRKVTREVQKQKKENAAANKQSKPEQKPAAANAKKASQPKPVAVKKQASGKTSWVNAFFGGRYPGEAKEDYRTRLSALAQPSLNK